MLKANYNLIAEEIILSFVSIISGLFTFDFQWSGLETAFILSTGFVHAMYYILNDSPYIII